MQLSVGWRRRGLFFTFLCSPILLAPTKEALALVASSSKVETNPIGSKLDPTDEKDAVITDKVEKPQRKQKADSQGQQQIAMDVPSSEFDTIDQFTVLEAPNVSTGLSDCCR